MRRTVTIGLVAIIATLTAWGFATPALADGDPGGGNGSPTNTAIAQNTKDGSSVFKLAFQIRRINDAATVDPGNAAVAIASCNDCQTVAIAVQVVFVVGSPTVFTPENAAVAVNTDCSFCDTLATAYQFVVQSSVPVRLTNDGKHQVHDIFKALQALDGAGLSVEEIQAKVDELMQQLATVLATEVEPIPGPGPKGPDDQSAVPSSSTTTTTVNVTTSTSTSTTTTSSTTTTTTTSTSSSS